MENASEEGNAFCLVGRITYSFPSLYLSLFLYLQDGCGYRAFYRHFQDSSAAAASALIGSADRPDLGGRANPLYCVLLDEQGSAAEAVT